MGVTGCTAKTSTDLSDSWLGRLLRLRAFGCGCEGLTSGGAEVLTAERPERNSFSPLWTAPL